MRYRFANRVTLRPFPILRQLGLSSIHMQRLERYRTKHERLGRVVVVMNWPDGIWCAVAMHTENFSLVAIDDDQKAAAYGDARSMIEGDYLPLVSLRWEFHA